MFFLLRTAFWLGLSFSAIEWPADRPVVPTINDFTAQATAQAARVCTETPRACLEAAKHLQGGNNGAAPEAKPAKRRIDTLDSADRAPAWRGRG